MTSTSCYVLFPSQQELRYDPQSKRPFLGEPFGSVDQEHQEGIE